MRNINSTLEQIRDLWNNYIFKLKFFHKHYNFDEATVTNHFGQILDHFSDSLPVLENTELPKSIHARYSFNISLLQTIYVHQDLIEEMHRIFKTGVNKGKLYEDVNYKINREIRNDLVGHPIRRKNGNGVMISSVTLSYHPKPNYIEYARYHKSSNYDFQIIQHSVQEIIERHLVFLNDNLNQIYLHINKSLQLFLKKIKEIQAVLESNTFDGVVRLVENHYETFQDENYLYQSNQILKVYNKKEEHPRYQLTIDIYKSDLDYHLKQMTNTIIGVIENKEIENISYPINVCKHYYEIGKLFTKRNYRDFEFFGNSLRKQVPECSQALEELSFMEENIEDEVNYYSSCLYLQKILTERYG